MIGFEGIETMDDAEALAGAELKVPAASAGAAAGRGRITGTSWSAARCRTPRGGLIGEVAAVEGPIEMSRLVINAPHGEVLIPLVAEICVEVDPAAKRIRIAAPEGCSS